MAVEIQLMAKVKATGERVIVEPMQSGLFGRVDGVVAIYKRDALDFDIPVKEITIPATRDDEMMGIPPMREGWEAITTLHDYQSAAMRTCMRSCYNIPYMLFNLQGEVGELSSKIAKAIRKEQMWFADDDEEADHNEAMQCMTIEDRADFDIGLKGELGDVLWQLTGLCEVLGFSLQEVAEYNIHKLASRQQRGVIDGNGDDR